MGGGSSREERKTAFAVPSSTTANVGPSRVAMAATAAAPVLFTAVADPPEAPFFSMTLRRSNSGPHNIEKKKNREREMEADNKGENRKRWFGGILFN